MSTSSFYKSSGSTPAVENSIQTAVTQAAGSATQAQTSATSANTSATNAQNSLNSFQQYYLGAYSSAPSTTQLGSMYFDTGTSQLYIWSGSSWDVTASANNLQNTDGLTEGSSNLYFTNERVDDRVNNLLTAGSNITLSYNDAANTLTIASTAQASSGSTDFVGLTDTPSAFTGYADQLLRVNNYETGVDFYDITAGDLDMQGNKVLFGNMYSQESNLPSAATYHGMFAHVHSTGKGYFAHGGGWHKLLDETSSTTTDLSEGSNLYFTNERVDDRVSNLLTAGSNITLTYNDSANTLTIASTASGTGGSTTFTGLTDTPSSMGTSGQYLAVNSGGNALEFVAAPSGGSGSSTFSGLTDTPASLGTAGQYLAVNSGATALEFVAAPSGGSGATTLSGLNDVSNATPANNQVLTWDSGTSLWQPITPTSSSSGIALTDLSASNNPPGNATLNYNSSTGDFIFTPPDLSTYITATSTTTFSNKSGNISQWTNDSGYLTSVPSQTLYDLSNVYSSSSPSDGQVLTWDNANSYWKPTTVSAGSGGIALTDLSATNGVAGNASLSYNSSTGQFAFTPPDLSGYATTASLSSYATTASLSSYATTASLATVATSGAYGDLSGTPNLSSYLTGITGESLYSLSNVYSSSNPSDGQVLTYDTTNGWQPETPSTFTAANYVKVNSTSTSATASGTSAIAIGQSASATGNHTVALGYQTSASGNKGIAIGNGSSASIIDIAIGDQASASGSYSTAIGEQASTGGTFSMAIGTQSSTSTGHNSSIALGESAATTAQRQLMLGAPNNTGGFTSIQVGNTSYTPSNAMDLTTKSYVDTAVAGAGGGIALTDLSVSTATASGTGSLTYNNTTGVFTFTPAASSGGGSSFAGADYFKVNSTGTAASATGGGAPIAIGKGAVASGTDAIAMGETTIAGSNSIGIGAYAGYSSQGGVYQVAMGYMAGYNNRAGRSTFIGYNAGRGGTNSNWADDCVALGSYALTTSSSPSGPDKSTAVGSQAMAAGSLSGANNSAFGAYAGHSINTGHSNLCMGYQSGYYLQTGQYNTVIGSESNATSTTSGRITGGSFNVYVGAKTKSSGINVSTETVLGYSLQGKGSQTFYVRAHSGAYHSGNTSYWSTTSDERVKKNIEPYTTGLTALNQVDVKSFNYKSDEEILADNPELANDEGAVDEQLPQDKLDIGIIAQQLETVLPNCVTTRENGMKSVVQDELFWVMVNAVKELSAKNDALEARIVALENA